MNFSQLQRLCVFSLSFLFLSVMVGYAQSEKLLTEISSSTAKVRVAIDFQAISKLEKHPNAKNVHYFRMGNLANVLKRGLFDFQSPVTGKTIHAMTIRIEYKSATDYLWYGTVSDSTVQGDMMLISEKGKIFGHLKFKDENYQIYSVSVGTSAFLPTLKTKPGSTDCGSSTEETKFKSGVTPVPNAVETIEGSCPNPNRVLIVYTHAAAALDPNIVQTVTTGVQNFNQAIYNSQASGNAILTLAGVVQTDSFTESPHDPTIFDRIRTDKGRIPYVPEIQKFRDDYKADIVVVLTNGDYNNDPQGLVGISYIGTNDAIALKLGYCIVEDAYANASNYIFVHELGHIFGGLHDTGDNINQPQWAKGYLFCHVWTWPFCKDYKTIMSIQDAPTVLMFSNTLTTVYGETLGTANNNVVNRMQQTAGSIAAYRPGTSAFSVSIDGPNSITSSGCQNYYSANLTCECGTPTYNWTVSSDGYNYYNPSTNSTTSVCVYPGSPYASSGKVYFKLVVTSCDGQTSTAFYQVNVSNIHYLRLDNSGILNNKINNGISLSDAVPNPASSNTTFEFTISNKQNLKIELLNELGQTIRMLENGEFEAGTYQHTLNTETLVNGLYLYRLSTAGNSSTIKKLLISK